MKLIVGLGNPGKEYETTKHNVGFMVIDELAKRWNVSLWQEDKKGLIAQANVNGEKILLLKPQTYMNLSGESVGPVMNWYKLAGEDVYVIYDDMDLPVGKLRIRKNGSAGGHNGIKSILAHACDDFIRFRVGIGRPLPQWTVVNHVLAPFREEDKEAIAKGIEAAATAIEGCLELGVDKGMNRYNPKKGGRPRQ